MRRDLFIAVALFIASICGALGAYKQLLDDTRNEEALVSRIPVGPSTLNILQHGRCIGNLRFTLERKPDGELLLAGDGEIMLRYKGELSKAAAKFGFGTDILGSIGYSQLSARFAESARVDLRTQGIDTIDLTMELLQSSQEPAHFDMQIPGPIILRENPDRLSYRLVYLHLGRLLSKLQVQTPAVAAAPAFELAYAESPCAAEEHDALDLTLYLETMRFFANVTSAS